MVIQLFLSPDPQAVFHELKHSVHIMLGSVNPKNAIVIQQATLDDESW